MRPEIHFGRLEPKEWIGKTNTQLYNETEELRVKVKNASRYSYDSSHFFIDDIYGKPALQVNFSSDKISFWNAKNSRFIESIPIKIVNEELTEQIADFTDKIEQGLTQCNECKQWVKEFRTYSFAGAVCKKCFNPNKHLPPDTSGNYSN